MTPKINRIRPFLFRIGILALSLVVSFLMGELILRIVGFAPWSYQFPANEPVALEYHPIFGWQSSAGSFQYSIPPNPSPIQVTVLPDRSRSTAPTAAVDSDTRPNIVMLGCSWMFGWAISDQDTLAWKLQETFPDWHVVNYGTGGYGTYQSLLRLEDSLPQLRPDVIVYGFYLHHEERNVASGRWLNALAQKSRRGLVSVPYVLFRGGRLERHGLTRYPCWPGRRYSAVIAALEKGWVTISASSRTRHAREATRQLFLEMKNLADQFHAKFLVVFFESYRNRSEDRRSYCDFADAHGIPYVDCGQTLDETLTVPGDGHPNAKANTRWFEAVEPAIRKLLAEKSDPKP